MTWQKTNTQGQVYIGQPLGQMGNRWWETEQVITKTLASTPFGGLAGDCPSISWQLVSVSIKNITDIHTYDSKTYPHFIYTYIWFMPLLNCMMESSVHTPAGNCAHYQKGGWWYHMCAHSNLNGVWYRGGHYRSRYQDGVYWAEFHGGSYSLKKVTMMVKPLQPTEERVK